MISSVLRMFDARRIFARVRSSVSSNWVLYLAVCAYIIVLSTITILKNRALLTSGFDLGIFNQAFSTTLFNQKLFYTTGDLSFNPGGSFFGTHFSPILFVLLPFYAICPNIENLLVMQTVILALGAFPIYWISRDKLGKKIGLIISIVYLVYPPLVLLNVNDFHLEPFISTFFLFGVYYFEREEWMKSFVFIILAMLTLEFAPIIGVFMALYGLRLYSKKRFRDKRALQKCFLIALLSILVFLLAYIAKASFNPFTSPLPSPFHYILSNPAEMLNVIRVEWEWKILYVITFLAPLAFLPLLAPEPLIMAFPWIGLSFISTYYPYYSVYYQYTGFVIPFVFVALPKAIERFKLDARRILVLILLPMIFFWLFIPTAPGSPWNYQLPIADERTELLQRILPLIPLNASVLTQNDIFPHLSNRMNVYMYLPKDSNITVDYVLVNVNSVMYDWQQLSYFGERVAPSQLTYDGLMNKDYGVLASASGLLLLKKGYSGKPVLFVPFDSKYNYENLSLKYGSAVSDPTSTSRMVLYHGEEHQPGDFWYGPKVALLPGDYRVTYVTKVNGDDKIIKNENKTLFTVDVTYNSGIPPPIETTMVNGSRTLSAGQWFNSMLFFNTTTPIKEVEFRSHVPFNQSVSVCLDYLIVEQLYAAFNYKYLTIAPGQGNVSNGVMTHAKGTGTFWFGPYACLPKGSYTAKFWLRLDEPYTGSLIDIDVSSNNGTEILSSLTVHSSNFEELDKWQSFDVRFTLQDELNTVEFRGVNVRDAAPVSLLAVEVSPDTGPSQQIIYKTTFNYEDLSLVQGHVSDGVMTHVKGTGTFWCGPYTSLPKGNYTATFWLRLDQPYPGSLLDIDVSINSGESRLASLMVSDSDFKRIDTWQNFEVKFTIQEDWGNGVEFRGMNVRGVAPVSLLSVEVYSDISPSQQLIYKAAFNYEDLTLVQGTVSKGAMTHTRGNGTGTFWYGPRNCSLPKGNYTAKFWLKLDEPYDGSLLEIDVSTDSGERRLTSLMVSDSNFDGINTWRSFEVKFTIQEDWGNSVEFRGINVRDAAPVSCLLVEVSRY